MPFFPILRLKVFLPGLFLLCSGPVLLAQIAAFPGAEGAGAYATGGRGGDVYHVTNLNMSGAGSLADALATVPAQGRTVVFDVSGYIRVNGTMTLGASKVTIAGQTAPGDGIGITNGTFLVKGDDVIIRHFRFRDGYSADSLNIDSNSTNSIFDHVDVMLSNDENFSSFNNPPENVTFQWSINAWGMETHSAGGLWDIKNGTAHHTLWAHNHTRNPKARPLLLDWVNNVTFDWDIGFIMGDSATPADWKANVRGCYFVCPPGNIRSVALEKASLDRNGVPNFSLYLDDCLMDANGDGVLNSSKSGYSLVSGTYNKSATPFPAAGIPVTRDDPLTAYKKIVSAAGPLRLNSDESRPLRDELNSIVVSNLVYQKRHHVSNAMQTGARDGFGVLSGASPPVDTDRDGMPDYWEAATGSNPLADDHNSQAPAGAYVPSSPAGYTLLEDYLHFKAIPHAVVARNVADQSSSVQVDLSRYTAGFKKAPVTFTISNAQNGTATLGSDGVTATFVPALNFCGRARFNFAVQDGDGSAWTQTFAVLVTTTALPRNLQWKGDGSANIWNTTAPNWLLGSASVAFRNGDEVSLTDSGSATPPLSLSGSISPALLRVDAAQSYRLTGSGTLSGSMGIEKSGAGELLIEVGNSSTGPVEIQQGKITVSSPGDIGAGPLRLSGGTFASSYGPTTIYNLENPVEVPEEARGTILMSPRMYLNGISGAGTLDLYVSGSTFAYDNLHGGTYGNFTGILNIIGTVPNAQLTANFNGGSFDGNLASTTVHLDNVVLSGRQNSTGNTLKIGALTGSATGRLGGSGYAGSQTIQVGAKNQGTRFDGSITDGTAITYLQKVGSAELVLGGVATYTGATTITGGLLRPVNGIPFSAVTVGAGAILGGQGNFFHGITVQSGGTLSPGPGAQLPGTMTVGNVLTLTAPILKFDLGGTPGAPGDHVVMNGGTLNLSGAQAFRFTLLADILAPGTYPLITGAMSNSASSVTLNHDLPTGGRQTFALSRPASGSSTGYINLVVSGEPATLKWTGTNSIYWDLSSPNFLAAAKPEVFMNFDGVVFDDSAFHGLVTISGTVQPRSVVVSNYSREFTISGGSITGPAELTKKGSGIVSLNASNALSSGVRIEGGRLLINAAGACGAGPITLAGGALQCGIADIFNVVKVEGAGGLVGNPSFHNTLKSPVSGSGKLTIEVASGRLMTQESDLSTFTGQIEVNGGGAYRFNQGAFQWGNGAVSFHIGPGATLMNRATSAGATVNLGALSGAPASRLRGSDQATGAGSVDVYTVGALGMDTHFAGTIENGAVHATSLEKVGTGALTLSGANLYSGGTLVRGGTLVLLASNGSAAGAGPVVVEQGACLKATGTMAGALELRNDSVLELGGAFSVRGSLTAEESSFIRLSPAGGTNILSVAGDLELSSSFIITGAAALPEGRYVLLRCSGTMQRADPALEQMPVDGRLYFLSTSPDGEIALNITTPYFTTVSMGSSSLSISFTNGLPLGQAWMRASTNMSLPVVEWPIVSTQQFDASGSMQFVFPIEPSLRQQWFQVEIP